MIWGRDFLRSHSLGFLRSHSLDFLRSHSLDLVYFCVLGPGGPGPRALGPRGPFNTLRLVGDLRSHSYLFAFSFIGLFAFSFIGLFAFSFIGLFAFSFIGFFAFSFIGFSLFLCSGPKGARA